MTTATSRLNGAIAGRDFEAGEVLIDLVDHTTHRGDHVCTDRVARTVAERIPAGGRLEVRAGRLYPAEEARP